jgi:putative flippase GtrA
VDGVERATLSTYRRFLIGLLTPKTLTFLAVGGSGYVVDVVAFNWLRTTAVLHAMDPSVARVLAMCAAMVVTYVGNRVLTWRSRPRRAARRELILFAVFNLAGLALSLIPLFVTHDLLGLTSPLVDNVSANGVGLLLGTLFRYWAYDRFVFAVLDQDPDEAERPGHLVIARS